ncbi:chemotaxis protein CheA [Listeria costaricensis]|uniref:chemotaxis protein CheA n=1 Tax=Listeria costaricensis TaxID=2026604 RepID=UPI000C081741|nr:chemotaxis protein CheA [Listeria costaricensis]
MTTNMLDLFIEEASEHLQSLNDNMLQLEKEPENELLVSEIFRSAHTFKGMSATMGFQNVVDLTHAMENVLDAVRNHELAVTEHLVDIIFTCTSHLEEMVADISQGGTGMIQIDRTVAALNELLAEEAAHLPGMTNYKLTIKIDSAAVLKAVRAVMCLERLDGLGNILETSPSVQEIEEDAFGDSFIVQFESEFSAAEIEAALLDITEIETADVKAEADTHLVQQATKSPLPKTAVKKNVAHLENKTIRVQLEKIEKLMNMFEESVIERARIDEIAASTDNKELVEHLTRLGAISKEIQNGLLNMRMVPIENVFNRYPKMVRGLAKELGKKIELEITGADTEVDKIVIDEIGDPLVHLIRNSVDHGAETPDIRRAAGKSETATIRLEAFHSGNNVIIQISDDGAGINRKRVLEKAIEKGVIDRADAMKLSDREVFELLFDSGFSTAEQVSDISGRGVGLDVVRNTILKIGGKMTVDSVEGSGSTFRIEIPLTLSIIQSMLVETREHRYAVPLAAVQEVVTIERSRVENIHGKNVLQYRDSIIEVIDLSERLLEGPLEAAEEELLLVVKNAERTIGLKISEVIGQREIVLKTLGGFFSEAEIAFSGATILGDGRVVLVLNLETF